jgi:FkbM family methyltransferase
MPTLRQNAGRLMLPLRQKIRKWKHKSQRTHMAVEYAGCLFNLRKGKRPDDKIINGNYDTATLLLYRNIIKPGDTVFDIGANIGIHTVFMSQQVGSAGSVHAFEPVDFLARRLVGHLHLNGCENVKLTKAAVGDTEKTITFWQVDENEARLGNSSAMANNIVRGLAAKGAAKEVKVPQVALDNYIKDLNGVVKLIKLDVEGYELAVLRGAKKLLDEHKPILIMEFMPKRLEDLGIAIEEYQALLENDYDCFTVHSANYLDEAVALEPYTFTEFYEGGDLLCLPKSL